MMRWRIKKRVIATVRHCRSHLQRFFLKLKVLTPQDSKRLLMDEKQPYEYVSRLFYSATNSSRSCFRHTATRGTSGRRTLLPQLARSTAIEWSFRAIISRLFTQHSAKSFYDLRIDIEGYVLHKFISFGPKSTAQQTSPFHQPALPQSKSSARVPHFSLGHMQHTSATRTRP